MNVKAIKVKVYVDRSNGATNNIYPPVVTQNTQSIPMWLYPEGRDTEERDADGTFRWCIAFVDEAVADLFLADRLCEAATQREVEDFDTKENPRREVITDQMAVLTVLGKVAREQALSPEDKAVIDPSDPSRGITLTPTFSETLAANGHVIEW